MGSVRDAKARYGLQKFAGAGAEDSDASASCDSEEVGRWI